MLRIDLNPGRKALRTFGAIWLVAFGLLAVWAFRSHAVLFFEVAEASAPTVAAVLGAVALIGGLLAAAAPEALRAPYVVLSLVALPIGFVLSHLVVGLLFYVVVTPVGLVRRLFLRDPLTRRFLPHAASYWTRKEPVCDVTRYYRQY